MAEKAASGRQLFFDLIAAAGESQTPSAFESAAWAVAAEHPRPKTVQGASAEEPGPDSESLPERTADRIDPNGMARPESEEVVGLRLIDDEAQPSLAATI